MLQFLLQVTVREVDEEFIYGNYSCRATNQMGVGVHYVEMRQACTSFSLINERAVY